MFLDANNCYYIINKGLFVFYPEYGEIIFYAEKLDKTLVFEEIILDSENNKISFINCTSDKTASYTVMGTIKKLLTGAEVNIDFYSQNSNALFKTFFQNERLDKIDRVKERNQIDYLLVIKSSVKKGHASKEEPRILRIDWSKQKQQLKYYGEDKLNKINDFIIPAEKKGVYRWHIKSFFQTIPEEFDSFKQDLDIYIKKLLLNGFGQAFDTPDNNKTHFEHITNKLNNVGLLPTTISLEELLSTLDSSILKNNWLQQTIEQLSTYLNTLITNKTEITLGKLSLSGLGSNAYHFFKSNELPSSNIEFEITLHNAQNRMVGAAAATPVATSSKINFNLMESLKKQPGALNNKVAKCGASNCYFTVQDTLGNSYGLRLSALVYLNTDIVLYNCIIENIINCACYYYATLGELIGTSNFPEITDVLKFGLIKVNFTNDDGNNVVGYIPYTLTNSLPNYIQVKDYITQLCMRREPITECKVEEILHNILEQVYNFYLVMRTYFKFSHFDFKTDNILINTETKKIYIIDFGNAQMNIYSEKKIFYLSNRFVAFEGEEQTEYNWYIKNINNLFYSDNDIEMIIWWLINNFSSDDIKRNSDDSNKKKYFEFAKKYLEYIQPINKSTQTPMGNNITVLGKLLKDNNLDNFDSSLIIYRLYQLHFILEQQKSVGCDYASTKLISHNVLAHFRKYVLSYNEKDFIRLQQILIPLYQSLPTQSAQSSQSSQTQTQTTMQQTTMPQTTMPQTTIPQFYLGGRRNNKLHKRTTKLYNQPNHKSNKKSNKSNNKKISKKNSNRK